MDLSLGIFKKAGIIISKQVTYIFVFMYLLQNAALVYLVVDKMSNEKIIRQQEKRISELEEKLKIFKIIEDFQVGFNREEIGQLTTVIYNESKTYGYDALLVLALILTESSFQNNQVSHKGAHGLMQLKPSVGYDLAKRKGLDWKGRISLFEPAFNIKLGTLYLFELILKFGDVKKGIIAYNQGENSLRLRIKSGGELPKLFLSRVMNTYKKLKEKYNNKPQEIILPPISSFPLFNKTKPEWKKT